MFQNTVSANLMQVCMPGKCYVDVIWQFLFLNQVYGLKIDKVSLSCDNLLLFQAFLVKVLPFCSNLYLMLFISSFEFGCSERPQHCLLVLFFFVLSSPMVMDLLPFTNCKRVAFYSIWTVNLLLGGRYHAPSFQDSLFCMYYLPGLKQWRTVELPKIFPIILMFFQL